MCRGIPLFSWGVGPIRSQPEDRQGGVPIAILAEQQQAGHTRRDHHFGEMFKNDKRIARDDSIARQRWQEFLPLVGVVGWVGEHDVVVTTPQARLYKETSHATGM